MDFVKSLIAGFAGSAALNILHETVRKFDNQAPRLDLIGEEALQKSTKTLHLPIPTGDKLYNATIIGDILSNATYYTGIGMGSKKFLIWKALGYGLSAGLAAIKLPKPIGLDDKPVASSDKRKVMSLGYYVFGALITAGVFGMISKK